MTAANPLVDKYLTLAKNWQEEQEKLRAILLDCGLTEELKWGKPCYTWHDKNVVVVQGFKEYCALLFMKGYLMDDPKGILVKTGANTRVGRQIRFTDMPQIYNIEATLKAYVREAIRVEKSGVRGTAKEKTDIPIPEEFRKILSKNSDLETAFYALTPGRQRGYLLHFSQPKQSKTRTARIEKAIPHILKGKGLNG